MSIVATTKSDAMMLVVMYGNMEKRVAKFLRRNGALFVGFLKEVRLEMVREHCSNKSEKINRAQWAKKTGFEKSIVVLKRYSCWWLGKKAISGS